MHPRIFVLIPSLEREFMIVHMVYDNCSPDEILCELVHILFPRCLFPTMVYLSFPRYDNQYL